MKSDLEERGQIFYVIALTIIIPRKDIKKVFDLIKSIDPTAFMFTQPIGLSRQGYINGLKK